MTLKSTYFDFDLPASKQQRAPSPRVSEDFVAHWYVNRTALVWSITNVLAALLVATSVWDSAAVGYLAAWTIFVCLNAGLYFTLASQFSREIGRYAITHAVVGLAFGAIWSVFALSVLPDASVPSAMLVTMTMFVVAIVAIPVFTLHAGAYPIFLLPLLGSTVVAFYSNTLLSEFAAHVAIVTILLFALSIAYAGMIRRVIAALSEFSQVARAGHHVDSDDFTLKCKLQARALKRQLREQRRTNATLDAVGEAVITATDSGLVDYMNPVAEMLTGIAFNQANGRKLESVLRLYTPHEGRRIHLTGSGEYSADAKRSVLKRADGIEYEIDYLISPLRHDSGETSGVICLLRDITALRHLAEKLAWSEIRDPRTKLINRPELEERIEHLLRADENLSGEKHALCLVDIDNFASLNQYTGVACANEVLLCVASALKKRTRDEDTIARYGADQFAILFYDCDIERARTIAVGLNEVVTELALPGLDDNRPVSTRCGVVAIEAGVDDLSTLFGRVENACEAAKGSGDDKVEVLARSDHVEQFRLANRAREAEIRAAITRDALHFNYQTITAARDDSLESACELLPRMDNSNENLLSPRNFLVANQINKLLLDLDNWALHAAIKKIEQYENVELDVDTVFLSISGRCLNDAQFLSNALSVVTDCAVADILGFRISEVDQILDLERTGQFFAELQIRGCSIALNMSGNDSVSFDRIKRLKLDYLVIGADTIVNMSDNTVDYEIVLATIRIAKSLGIRTIASGVSTREDFKNLEGMGVDFIQGYLIGQPRPLTPSNVAAEPPLSDNVHSLPVGPITTLDKQR